MIGPLFGNKSIERILFFLLINRKCYAGKIARLFNTALTPIQQGLAKLEEIGVLESFTEGKIRYYEFNPNCPFLNEFESFLRKTYTLLPDMEKKIYYDPDTKYKNTMKLPKKIGLVVNVWSKLASIKNLSFSAVSQSQVNSGWNGVGKGEVKVKKINDSTLVFLENGSWTSREGQDFSFTNVFRWSLDRFQQLITLEHLRFGDHNPVFLFHLTQTGEEVLDSVNSHVCKEDTYLGQLKCNDHFIQLNWRIIGPKKNEEIDYLYT